MEKVVCVQVAEAELEPWRISREQVRAGDPRASGMALHEAEDGTGTGIWECTPGSFDWLYETHQSMCVLAGEATVEVEGGPTLELRAGHAVFFASGTRARWTVRSTVRKVYTLYR